MATRKLNALIGSSIGKIDKSDVLADGDILVYNATTTKWETKQMSAIAAFVEAAQDAVGAMMVDSTEIDFTYTDATPALTGVLINGSVAYARIVNAAAVSVLGRSANSSGVLADIAAGADDRILRRTASTINFGQLTDGMFPASITLTSSFTFSNATNTFGTGQLVLTRPYNSTAALLLQSTTPGYVFEETDAAANSKKYFNYANGSSILFGVANDAESVFTNWMIVGRTGMTVDSIALAATAITLNGVASSDFARLNISNGFSVNNAAAAQQTFANPNTGTGAYSNLFVQNSTHSFRLAITSTGWSGAFLTGGPTGEQCVISSAFTIPLVFGYNDSYVAQFTATEFIQNLPVRTKGYTVATLPAGTLGMIAHVTDALAPAFLAAVVGGGAVKSLVFYDGTNWVAA